MLHAVALRIIDSEAQTILIKQKIWRAVVNWFRNNLTLAGHDIGL